MIEFSEYLNNIEDINIKNRLTTILKWIKETYPNLIGAIKWKQPMFILNNSFIIGFSYSKNHIAIAPEQVVVEQFSEQIKAYGYNHTKMLIQFPHNKEVNYELLKMLIDNNILNKKNSTSFWRK